MRNFHSVYLACAVALSLSGCWEPEKQETLTRAPGEPGGPWDDCLMTLDEGVSGDICTFEGGCAEGAAPRGQDPVVIDYVAAACADSGVLARSELEWEVQGGLERFEDPTDQEWAPDENGETHRRAINPSGCLVLTSPLERTVHCVGEDLLPPVDSEDSAPPIALTPATCSGHFRDVGVMPGAACSGEGVICDDRSDEPSSAPYTQLIVWCHNARLRYVDPIRVL